MMVTFESHLTELEQYFDMNSTLLWDCSLVVVGEVKHCQPQVIETA